MLRTFSIQTLGCKVNQYESEQVATLLRSRGLRQVGPGVPADVRVVNTCSVTTEAAGKSRQAVRRTTRLPVLSNPEIVGSSHASALNPRVLVMGCWATGDSDSARAVPGVDAVLTHADNVACEIDRLLEEWSRTADERSGCHSTPGGEDGCTGSGTRSLPMLSDRHTGHQRAFVKVQDGCDAHCTYCIIPQLRPVVWSRPIDDVVEEARRLVDAGHLEIVLTGIFIGAYGQTTALRRRQGAGESGHSLARLVETLAHRVPALRRIRFSSLEPGDLEGELLRTLSAINKVVPHFHLPLQSGSDEILRRMNRQYRRDDYLRMIDAVRESFDRPALTTDIICGFPGETDTHFAQTMEVVDRAGFIHVHAFPFSPRPGTAAARWTDTFVPADVTRTRMQALEARASSHDLRFRSAFLGEEVEILVESADDPAVQHGRCERYFDVRIKHHRILTGRAVQVRIDGAFDTHTDGSVLQVHGEGGKR